MDIVDYAQHLMALERMLKEAHSLCLHKNYMDAGRMTYDIIDEARKLSMCLHYMDVKENSFKKVAA
jgi:hypothetical protein